MESKNRYLSKEKSFREGYKVGKPYYERTEILSPLLVMEIKDRILIIFPFRSLRSSAGLTRTERWEMASKAIKSSIKGRC